MSESVANSDQTAAESVYVPVPPPPPRFDPRPTMLQQRLLIAFVSVGAIVVTLGYALDVSFARTLQRGGLFLLCYAGVVAASWLPASVLSKRLDAMLDRWVQHGASGYYGMMALATYVHLELRTVYESTLEFEFDSGFVRDALMQWVTGFSIESMLNFVKAMAWPGMLWGKQAAGLAPVILVAATWAAYELGRRFLPQPKMASGVASGPETAPRPKRRRG